VIIKRKSKDGKVKNLKVSVYREKRVGYCEKHQKQQEKHRTPEHKCSIDCSQSRQLQKKVKECSDCKNPALKKSTLRKQIKRCEQVIDLLVIEPSRKREDLGLLLVKEDNNCLKKP